MRNDDRVLITITEAEWNDLIPSDPGFLYDWLCKRADRVRRQREGSAARSKRYRDRRRSRCARSETPSLPDREPEFYLLRSLDDQPPLSPEVLGIILAFRSLGVTRAELEALARCCASRWSEVDGLVQESRLRLAKLREGRPADEVFPDWHFIQDLKAAHTALGAGAHKSPVPDEK